MKTIIITMMTVAVLALSASAQEVSEDEARRLKARYPSAWEVTIPQGTKLAALAQSYQRRLARIPAKDLEDQGPYPLWFRAYLREHFPGLPTQGYYQYPRVAAQILEWMMTHPDLEAPPPEGARNASKAMAAAHTISVSANINITNFDERNSESFIAVDYADPQFLVAAANNISGSGRQKQFRSSDAGTTWNSTELPLATGSAFNSDPAVAWTTDGTAWAATLGINNLGTSVQVQVYKSTDRGATWNFVKTVSSGTNNDKELMWIDTHSASPQKDNIYVAWDVPGGGMRFARSTDRGASWSAVTTLSSDSAIGAHLASGPAGELYVAWPDVATREIRIRKSTDGGATFAPMKKIATTNDSFEISIPAMCSRKALIYVSVAVDRSSGPRSGWVYAAWADRNGSAGDPGCDGVTSASNANIYFSRSADGGNTWSPPAIVHTNPARTDQFNQWMDVDPEQGAIHVIYYDTRDDPGRQKAHVYYVRSDDGGNSWVDETRVTTAATDETASPADLGNQYGDYNGLVAYRSVAHPVWTDRRAGVPGNKEQIFTAGIRSDSAPVLTLVPTAIEFNRTGLTTPIDATLTGPNGAPVPNVNVDFSSADPNVATVAPPMAVTDGSGSAQATVTGVNGGETDIEARAQKQSVKTHVKVQEQVPAVSIWGLLILALVCLLFLQRRRPKPGA
jgi:Bacterial Ig-like domain (group 1)